LNAGNNNAQPDSKPFDLQKQLAHKSKKDSKNSPTSTEPGQLIL
jgi:hypothetical protein